MQNYSYELPYWGYVLLFSIAPLALVYILFFALRYFRPNLEIKENDSDFIAALHAALFTITFLTLGYSLVAANDTIGQLQTNVINEANEIAHLDFLLSLDESKKAAQFRSNLHRYAESIVIDEWPMLAAGVGSSKTNAEAIRLKEDFRQAHPSGEQQTVLYREVLQGLKNITFYRNSRIQNSGSSIGSHFMLASYMGFLGVLLISVLMLTQFSWFRHVSIAIQVIAVSFIFSSTLTLDNPFKGEEVISSKPISQAISGAK